MCYSRLNKIKGLDKSPEVMKNIFNDDFERRFGVEFELNSIIPRSKSISMLKKELKTKSKYIKAKGDGSLDDYKGIEIITGVYCGKRGFNLLKLLCSKFKGLYSADRKCGLHIHLDTRDLTREDLINLHYIYKKIEPYFIYYVRKDRINNSYCKPLNKIGKGEYIDKDGKTIDNYSPDDRYRAVNFHSLKEHGTIEIRLMEGNIDYEKIKEWLMFHMCVISYVKKAKDKIFHLKFNKDTFKEILTKELFDSLMVKINGNKNIVEIDEILKGLVLGGDE